MDGYRSLLHHPYSANCTRTVILDDAPAAGGDIGATVLLDCDTWRTTGSKPVSVATQ